MKTLCSKHMCFANNSIKLLILLRSFEGRLHFRRENKKNSHHQQRDGSHKGIIARLFSNTVRTPQCEHCLGKNRLLGMKRVAVAPLELKLSQNKSGPYRVSRCFVEVLPRTLRCLFLYAARRVLRIKSSLLFSHGDPLHAQKPVLG